VGRQKLLLAAVRELRRHRKYAQPKLHTAIMKTLFLLSREYDLGTVRPYAFFPYKFGPYSATAFGDLTYNLQRKGYLDENESLTPKGEAEIAGLDSTSAKALSECVSRFKNDVQLLEYVYAKYPAYAVRSELKPQPPKMLEAAAFTIGYEGCDIDAFLDKLIQNDVQALVDVRNNPFSMNFAFVKSKLEKHLTKAGIEYRHVPELGIESEKRKNLQTQGDYAELFDDYEKNTLPSQQQALETIAGLGKEKRIALMCFEHDASNCHRGVIAKALRQRGMEVTDL